MAQLDNQPDFSEPKYYNTGSSLLKKYDIPLHHLDFDYVNKCKDANELEKILIILRSGEEGHYPQLIARTEECIAKLKPNSKHLRKLTRVMKKEELDAELSKDISGDICSFINHMVFTDEELTAAKKKTNQRKVPQVRVPNEVKQQETKINPARIRSTDYSAWDKYDAETELLKMDLEEEKMRKAAEKTQKKKTPEVKRPKVTINEFSTKSEAKHASMEETSKAMEYLKVKEYEAAVDHYTLAIEYLPSRCTYTNRAGAYMMMNRYKDAISDYETALKYDSNNFETIYSLSYSHYKLGHHDQAYHFIQKAITIDPNNEYAQTLAQQIHQQLNERNAGGKVRMKIVEVKSQTSGVKSILRKNETKDDNKKNKDGNKKNKDGNKENRMNGKTILALPGCSKMPGPYYKVINSQDPVVVKREEMLIAAQPKRIFMGSIDVVDDDGDCLVNHFEGRVRKGVGVAEILGTREDVDIREEDIGRQKEDEVVCRSEQDKYICRSEDVCMSEEDALKPEEDKDVFVPEEDIDAYVKEEAKPSIKETKDVKHTQDDSINPHLQSPRNATTLTESLEERIEDIKDTGERTKEVDWNGNQRLTNAVAVFSNNLTPTISQMDEKDLKGGGEPCLEENNNNVVADAEIHVPFSFLQAWQNGRKMENYAGFVDILKSLDMTRIPQVIGNKMDARIFSEILNCTYRHLAVVHEVDKVHSTLVNLCKVDRFCILALFLSADDKRLVRNLLDFLSQHGKTVPQDLYSQYGV